MDNVLQATRLEIMALSVAFDCRFLQHLLEASSVLVSSKERVVLHSEVSKTSMCQLF